MRVEKPDPPLEDLSEEQISSNVPSAISSKASSVVCSSVSSPASAQAVDKEFFISLMARLRESSEVSDSVGASAQEGESVFERIKNRLFSTEESKPERVEKIPCDLPEEAAVPPFSTEPPVEAVSLSVSSSLVSWQVSESDKDSDKTLVEQRVEREMQTVEEERKVATFGVGTSTGLIHLSLSRRASLVEIEPVRKREEGIQTTIVPVEDERVCKMVLNSQGMQTEEELVISEATKIPKYLDAGDWYAWAEEIYLQEREALRVKIYN
jgi:hypothetical protein